MSLVEDNKLTVAEIVRRVGNLESLCVSYKYEDSEEVSDGEALDEIISEIEKLWKDIKESA